MWFYDMLHQVCTERGITYHRSQSGRWLIRTVNGTEWVAHSSKRLCELLTFLLSNPLR